MSLKKRLVAGCLALTMAISMAGCTNKTGYIMKADGDDIQSGVYISLMLSEYTNQLYTIYYSGGTLEEKFEDQMIGDQKLSDYLENYAYETCLNMAATEKKCKELGISLTDEETKEVNSTVNTAWDSNGDYYEEMGISKESLRRIQTYSKLSEKLFEGLYYENGVEAVKDEEIDNYVSENLLRYKQIFIAIDDDDEDTAKETSDKYMKLAEDGATMDELIEAYKKETSDDEDSDDDSSDDSSESDSSSETDSSSESDSSETDSSSVVDESSETEDSSENDNSSDTESSSTDDNSSETDTEEEEKTDAEIESEKYPNEYVRDKSSYEDNEYIDFIASLEYGKISVYEDEDGYYIVERLDMTERTEFAAANRESLIQAMKTDDYEKLIDDVANSLNIEKNSKSFEKYKAQDVYDRQSKWYEKNSD